MMDIFSAIMVVVPLIIPIANEFGIHPVHLAIIALSNHEIGYITCLSESACSSQVLGLISLNDLFV